MYRRKGNGYFIETFGPTLKDKVVYSVSLVTLMVFSVMITCHHRDLPLFYTIITFILLINRHVQYWYVSPLGTGLFKATKGGLQGTSSPSLRIYYIFLKLDKLPKLPSTLGTFSQTCVEIGIQTPLVALNGIYLTLSANNLLENKNAILVFAFQTPHFNDLFYFLECIIPKTPDLKKSVQPWEDGEIRMNIRGRIFFSVYHPQDVQKKIDRNSSSEVRKMLGATDPCPDCSAYANYLMT